MERLRERLAIARRAFQTLDEILSKPVTAEIRDASIQRFEYTYEALWKTAALFLREVHGVEAPSPKTVIRSAHEVGLLDDAETRAAMALVNDRNLTVHTYNEELAQQIYRRLPDHARLMERWLGRMESQLQRGPLPRNKD